MKIAMLIFSLKDKAGTERVACNLANALSQELGYEITLLNRDTRADEVAFPLRNEVKVEPLRGNYLSFFRQVQAYLDTHQPDVLLIHNMGRLSLLFSRLRKGKTRLISLEHGAFGSRPSWQRNLSKFLYPSFDALVTLTQADSKEYRDWFSPVLTIPNSSPYGITPPRTKASKIILAIGRLTYEKNFQALLDAWGLLQDQLGDWQLQIYGSGEDFGALQEQIARNQLKQVQLMGQADDLAKVYQEASFLVMSSRFEGLGMVLVEAQSFGLPLVSFDCPYGPAEIIHHEQNGLLVPNQDVPALAEAMRTLMTDQTLRETYASQALQDAQRFQSEAIVHLWKNLLEGEL